MIFVIPFSETMEFENIFCACAKRNLKVVKKFLDKGCDINSIDAGGWTPLIYSCSTGDVKIVEELLNRGADMEIKSDYGWTPLIYASHNNHLEVVLELLKRGADVEAKDRYGETALIHSLKYNYNPELVHELLMRSRSFDPEEREKILGNIKNKEERDKLEKFIERLSFVKPAKT